MTTIQETFPKCLWGWDLLAKKLEAVVKANMEVILSPKISRKKIKGCNTIIFIDSHRIFQREKKRNIMENCKICQ